MEEATGKPEGGYLEIEHPWVSHDLIPIYRWAFPKETTDEQLDAFVQAREDWATHAEYPVAWVVDLSNITKASATQRKVFAEHLKRFEEHDVRWNAGSALIVPAGWLRGVVTAVFWISPPRFPNKIFAGPFEGRSWAKRQLEAKLAEHRAHRPVGSIN